MNALNRTSVFEGEATTPPRRLPDRIGVFTQHRVVVQDNPSSSWVQQLEKRFEKLLNLRNGWDGYNGRAVSFNNAVFAAHLLNRICDARVPAPSLVPGSDGTLQAEWHRNGFDIEIDILAPTCIRAYRRRLSDDFEEEVELQSDVSLLARWISELADAQQA